MLLVVLLCRCLFAVGVVYVGWVLLLLILVVVAAVLCLCLVWT